MKKILGRIVKIHWDDACDSTGPEELIANKELLNSWTLGEVLGDRFDRFNLRHQYSEERGDLAEPHEGTIIPKGCITKIEIYKLDRTITYGLAQRHKRKPFKRKKAK